MEKKEILVDILREYVELPEGDVDSSEVLKTAVGMDSFVLMSFISAVEGRFDLKIPNDALRDFKTLDDIIAYLEEQGK
ncbi:MAG: acyl carrier protein [Bacteroidales bacterium]|nr:acyl carrier protein [Bacteroidales bacterium]